MIDRETLINELRAIQGQKTAAMDAVRRMEGAEAAIKHLLGKVDDPPDDGEKTPVPDRNGDVLKGQPVEN